MTDPRGQKIRVILRSLQILDRKEPFFKDRGEFRFLARVHTDNNGGITVETPFPEGGTWEITDAPGHNRLRVDIPIFEGYVEDHLAVEISGEEVDTIGANDALNPYRRVFTGAPASWVGTYGPGDESVESQDVGDWRLWLQVETA